MRRRPNSPTKTSKKYAEVDGRGLPSSTFVGAKKRGAGQSPSFVVRAALILLPAAFATYGVVSYAMLRRGPGNAVTSRMTPAAGVIPPAAEQSPPPTTESMGRTREDKGGGGFVGMSPLAALEEGEKKYRKRRGAINRGSIRMHPRVACLEHGGRPALLRGSIDAELEGGGMGSCAHSLRKEVPKSRTVELYPSEPYERSFQDPDPYIDRSMCVPAEPWQMAIGTNCNDFHEVDVGGSLVAGIDGNSVRWNSTEIRGGRGDSNTVPGDIALRLLGSGGWRTAWELSNPNIYFAPSVASIIKTNHDRSHGSDNLDGVKKYEGVGGAATTVPSVVLKMLKWDLDFTPDVYRRHSVDAVISGRMSSSPRVIDAYGYCGQSTMNELAKSSLLKAVKRLNLVDRESGKPNTDHDNSTKLAAARSSWPTLRQRIQYGMAAARALADVHTVDERLITTGKGKGEAIRRQYNITITHRDVKPDNFVLTEANERDSMSSPPIVKLGDFNDAELVYHNKTGRGGACRFRRWRFDAHYPSAEEAWESPLTPAVDVHGLGGVLFFILAGRKPFWDLNETFSFVHLTQGILPKMPGIVFERGEGELAVTEMLELMKHCRSLRAEDRPSAEFVAEEMDRILVSFEERHRDQM